jgi:hypothetical protein
MPGGEVLVYAFDPATGYARQARLAGARWERWRHVVIPITTQALAAAHLHRHRTDPGLYTIDEGAMYAFERKNGSWKNWAMLHGRHTSRPAAISLTFGDTGNAYVFSRGANNEIWWKGWSGQRLIWSDWWSLKGIHRSGPAAVGWIDDPASPEAFAAMFLFATGEDGMIWYREYGDSAYSTPYKEHGWSDEWCRLGPDVGTSDPAAALRAPNQFDLFVRGERGSVLHRRWDHRAWSPADGWTVVDGPPAASSPSAVWRNAETLDLFYCGERGELYWRTWTPDRGWCAAIPESAWPLLS